MTGFLVYLLIGTVVTFALDLLTRALLAQGELKKEEALEFTPMNIVLLVIIWPIIALAALATVAMSLFKGDDSGKGPDNFAY